MWHKKITSNILKASAHCLLAAGPLLSPPRSPAKQPNTSATQASVLAAIPEDLHLHATAKLQNQIHNIENIITNRQHYSYYQ